jgi:hypothetical protein
MNYSEALHHVKFGALMARHGWNGKNMGIFLVPGSEFEINREPWLTIFPPGTKIKYRAHIDLIAADGTVGPWTPSSTDQLADDWYVATRPPVSGVTSE